MPNLIEALSGGSPLSAADYQGMAPEQIQAVAGNAQKNQQLVNSLVMALAENRLKENSLSESARHNKAVEGLTAEKNKNDYALGQDLNAIRKRELSIKESANRHKMALENDLKDIKKRLMESQSDHLDAETESLSKQASIYEYKLKGIESLEDTEIDIGGQKFNGLTIATNPQIAQAWAASIPEQVKTDRKANAQKALIASGLEPEIVYGMDLGFKVKTPAEVKQELVEKGLSGGIMIKGTLKAIDEAAPIIAYEYNEAIFGRNIADRINSTYDNPDTGGNNGSGTSSISDEEKKKINDIARAVSEELDKKN